MAGTDLQRTWGTPTDAKKYTLSLWLKRCNSGSIDWIMNTAGDFTNINFRADDTLEWGEYTSGVTMKLVTDRKFRDPGAWYHLVFAYDSTTSAGDRQRMYVNGVEETSFSTDTNSALNYSSVMNSAVLHSLGSQKAEGYANYSNVVMAHVHFTDGTAYAPTVFGETDATSGIWIAKSGPSVTYGDNGFFLKFASGAEGTDSSGEGNNWTVSNGTMTQTKDTPDNNFCTINPLDDYWQEATYSNGNTKVVTESGSSVYAFNTGTMGVSSGKWYWEMKMTNSTSAGANFYGVAAEFATSASTELGQTTNQLGFLNNNTTRTNNTATAFGDTGGFTTGDIMGCALDMTNSRIFFAKNGVWMTPSATSGGDPTDGTGNVALPTAVASTPIGAYLPAFGSYVDAAQTYEVNFGNPSYANSSDAADENGYGAFEFAPPSNYLAICTKNLGSDGG